MKFGIHVGFSPQTSNVNFFSDRFPSYGELIFWKFWENEGGSQLQNTISFELVVQSGKVRYPWKGGKARIFSSDINFAIWVNFGVITFWPTFWHWDGPCGSNFKILIPSDIVALFVTYNISKDGIHKIFHFWVITRASFCCSKKVRKLHLFSTKVAFMRTSDCERLDTTYFRLHGLGQKPRFSALPPLIEFGHCRTWLGL